MQTRPGLQSCVAITAAGLYDLKILLVQESQRGTAMKRTTIFTSLAFLVIASISIADDGQWQSLFDGKSLEGWNAEDHSECFKV